MNLQQQNYLWFYYIISLHSTSSSSSPSNQISWSEESEYSSEDKVDREEEEEYILEEEGVTHQTSQVERKELCAALGDNIFTYNEKEESYKLAITLRQTVKHIGKVYGQGINNKTHNLKAFIIVKTDYDK